MSSLRLAIGLSLGLAASAGPGAPWAQDDRASAAAEAEMMADLEFGRENYPAAESKYRESLAARPNNPHALIRLATLLSWRGEYGESIELYRRALAFDPSREEAVRGLALTYAWAEQFDRAFAMYKDLLARRPGDEGITFELAQAQAWSGDLATAEATLHGLLERNPRHVKARVLLGQVHAWQGETAEAEKIFRSVLATDPDNTSALVGMGDVLVDLGRNEEARAHYDKALARDPKNRKALEGRARALHYEGRTPEALTAVRDVLELYPDARDARRLGREIGGPLRPALQLFGTTSQDTDDNDLATWGMVYTHYLGGRGYWGVSYTHAQTDARVEVVNPAVPANVVSATPVARYDTARLTGGAHFSRRVSLYGEWGAERTEVPFPTGSDPNDVPFLGNFGAGSARESRSHPAGSVTLELNPAGWLTLVGSVSAERLVGTTQAFMNDVGIQAGTLTAIFRPHRLLKLRLTGQKARFTDDDDVDIDSRFLFPDPNSPSFVPDDADDNDRTLVSGSISWRMPARRPRLFLNYLGRRMSYDENVDHGYFDPDRFVSHVLGFDISDSIGDHVYWGGGFDRGVQKVNDRDSDDVIAYRLLAGLNVGEAASLEAFYARSDSALQSAAGFKSTEAGLRIRIRFGGSLGPASPAREGPGRNDPGGR